MMIWILLVAYLVIVVETIVIGVMRYEVRFAREQYEMLERNWRRVLWRELGDQDGDDQEETP